MKLEIPYGTEIIKNYEYENRADITEVVIPSTVVLIGYKSFAKCKNLKSVIIPNSVTMIDWSAFYGCTNLTNVIIPNSVVTIGENAFRDCTNLTNVIIPGGVISIENGAFRGCTSLTSVIIPNSVISIDDYAFYCCDNLTTVAIPNSVKYIGYRVFKDTEYYNNPINWKNDVLYINNHLIKAKNTLSGVYTIKKGTKTIAGRAFEYCYGLTSVTIPDSVTSINYGVFYDCTGLTNITIPDSVKLIEDWAFYNCEKLKSDRKSYKAFHIKNNGELWCTDYKFTPNKWSKKEENIRLCEKGYHYCTNLFEIFNYYWGELDKDIAIYECEVGDKIIMSGTSKCVTNTIKPVRRIYKNEIINLLNGEQV